ncbi:permease [Hydrogenimonas cancrithermarum]|uniref:Permease n=1 Tax=Hydrogenimonas cancrithermarum TaxID=2993563 RepID=A0ABM8FHY7_9BACT|nr:permease [Hydrogenimonas cancrithermarum]BDY11894.1 hypothetical protein HCR_02060 [Hydrogenimonas cancrithermarum]
MKRKDGGRSFKKALKQASMGLVSMMPMILAVIGLVGLFQAFVTEEMLASLFTGDPVKDTFIGTVAGGIAVGQALISYILGGELLEQGISMYAVTAFILAWVTLGVVQLPAEAEVLGVRFTVYRNILAFVSTLLVSIATVWTLGVFG